MGTCLKVILMILPVLIILAGVTTGCDSLSTKESGDKSFPFYSDRVATIPIVMEEEDWSFCLESVFEEQYVPADFWFDDKLIPDVGVRPKGNSSLGQDIGWDTPRIPLAVDFNLFNRARNFHGVKEVFLNNGWSDPTLLREMVAYEIFAEMGIPTPRASLVDVWINDNHLGVYTMVEMVDQAFIARHFDDASGYLYKPELVGARPDWTEEDAEKELYSPYLPEPPPRHDPALYTNIGGAPLIDLLKALDQEEMVSLYTPILPAEGNLSRGLPPVRMPRNYLEAMALKTNENNPDYSGLFRLLDVLNNETDDNFIDEIEKVLDVEEVLIFIATSAVIVHLDNYIGIGHNYYLYEVNGKFSIIPWDSNMAFGTFNMAISKEGLINYYIDEPTGSLMYRFPLVYRLLSQPLYLEKYHDYIQELINGPFDLDRVVSRIEQLVEIVRLYAEADKEMFHSYEDWERCFTEDLRPPDIYLGWMAGGSSPLMPFILPRDEAYFLKQNLDVTNLYELLSKELTNEDLETLEEGLSENNYSLFLQNLFGPLMAPQPPRQPGFGPNSFGLITFIEARYESVIKQLNGELPSSSGMNLGNRGDTFLIDIFNM